MGRYVGPSCRLCRREGVKLFLKGLRCQSAKCQIERRQRHLAPGMHGWRRPRRSEYLKRLREKQKVKRYYGVLERPFMRYFRMAARRPGDTGKVLLELLERRLDNVVFKLNWASSRKAARQLITHGHIRVNGHKVDIPSYVTNVGDRISVKNCPKSIKKIREQLDSNPSFVPQNWLQLDRASLEATVVAVPSRQDVQIPVEEQLIVEICAR